MLPGLPPVFSSELNRMDDVFSAFRPIRKQTEVTETPEEMWVQQELKHYDEQFTQQLDLSISVTTFNVGCKKPGPGLERLVRRTVRSMAPPADVAENVGSDATSCSASGSQQSASVDVSAGRGLDAGDVAQPNWQNTDLVFIGFQEVDMSATALLRGETEAAVPWVTGMSAAIKADSDPRYGAEAERTLAPYYAFPPRQMVGLLLCVYIRRPLLRFVREFSIESVPTGTLGAVGNKGGVGLRLVLHSTSLCLITAHLAAGQSNVSKRNEDIEVILSNMDFNTRKREQLEYEVRSGGGNTAALGDTVYAQVPISLPKDNDVVIVAGDLNYRLDLTYEAAVRLAAQRDYAALLKEDQLQREMKNPHTPWKGFRDLTPTFPPTYRFDFGTDTYDTSEKRRIPSYTDRILTWSRRKKIANRIRTEQLDAVMAVTSSDHKPVNAVLRIPVSVEIPKQKQAVTEDLRNRVASIGLDRAASAKTTLLESSLDFGAQKFHACSAQETLHITNTGECVAVVNVFRQVDGDRSLGAWLRVYPTTASILPGETMDITVECQFHHLAIPWMSQWAPFQGNGSMAFKSMLLIRVRRGAMHAVECTVVMTPSVFGNSLYTVSMLHNVPCVAGYNATSMELTGLTAGEANPSAAEGNALQTLLRAPSPGVGAPGPATMTMPHIPKELWYLCDAIYQRGAQVPNLFSDSGSPETCVKIMDFLDTHNEPIPDTFPVDCVATCLLRFLQSLQEPVVPYALYNAAIAAGRARGRAPLAFVRQQLPALHANVWIYVCSLLNYLVRPINAAKNELTPQYLAQLFSSVLVVRPSPLKASVDALYECTYGSTALPGGGSASAGGTGSSQTSLSTSGVYSPGQTAGSGCNAALATGAAAAGGGTSAASAKKAGDGGQGSVQERQRYEQEQEDAVKLVQFFLTPPPEILY